MLPKVRLPKGHDVGAWQNSVCGVRNRELRARSHRLAVGAPVQRLRSLLARLMEDCCEPALPLDAYAAVVTRHRASMVYRPAVAARCLPGSAAAVARGVIFMLGRRGHALPRGALHLP